MLNVDEDALQCDLAETYGIYDYRELPPTKVALFSVGLRDDSRIKMKIGGLNHPLKEIILATIADRLGLLVWFKTEDGMKNKNRPESIVDSLLGEKEERKYETFDSLEEFQKKWNELS